MLLLRAPLLNPSELRQIDVVNIPGAPGFDELAFANGTLVMTHAVASAVDVFDPMRRLVVAQVTGLRSLRGVAVDESGGKVYVADHGSKLHRSSRDRWMEGHGLDSRAGLT